MESVVAEDVDLLLQEAGHVFQVQFGKRETVGAESQWEILSDKICPDLYPVKRFTYTPQPVTCSRSLY